MNRTGRNGRPVRHAAGLGIPPGGGPVGESGTYTYGTHQIGAQTRRFAGAGGAIRGPPRDNFAMPGAKRLISAGPDGTL